MSRPSADPIAVRVERLGVQGDGVVRMADGSPAHLPGVLPGEVVDIGPGPRPAVLAIRQASPDRVKPPCPHFGRCGGCALQHWADAPYAAWKRDLLVQALARAGFPDVLVAPLVRTPPGVRRRVDLAVGRDARGIRVGLHVRGAAEIVPIGPCPVLAPPLEALLSPLPGLLAGTPVLRRTTAALVNLLDDGPDLLLSGPGAPTLEDRGLLAGFAFEHRLVRISWATGREPPEPVVVPGSCRLTLSGTTVTPPPGAFLQASREGEAAIVAAVLAALADVKNGAAVADLFAGIGTLSLALASRFRVTAIEGSAASVAALRPALGPRGTAQARDLARRPLTPAELDRFAAVVLDPPYAGAAPLVAQLAASKQKRVVYVSCNPAALARDAAALRAAGFRVVAATPIDQFLWSPHLESVVEFRR